MQAVVTNSRRGWRNARLDLNRELHMAGSGSLGLVRPRCMTVTSRTARCVRVCRMVSRGARSMRVVPYAGCTRQTVILCSSFPFSLIGL